MVHSEFMLQLDICSCLWTKEQDLETPFALLATVSGELWGAVFVFSFCTLTPPHLLLHSTKTVSSLTLNMYNLPDGGASTIALAHVV